MTSRYISTLENLSRSLGLPAGIWQDLELPDSFQDLRDRIQVPVDPTAAAQAIVDFASVYGEALKEGSRLWVLDRPDLDFALKPAPGVDAVYRFFAEAGNSGFYFRLRVDKAELLRGLGLPPEIHPKLVIYPKSLAVFLQQEGSMGLEAWWETELVEKVVVFVPEWKGFLNGPLLAVVGGDPATAWARLQADRPENPFKDVSPADLSQAREENLRWEEKYLKHLTPLHLLVRGEPLPGDSIAEALRILRANLCILFTADWTRSLPSGGRLASYTSAHHQAEIELAPPTHHVPREAVLGVDELERITAWAYQANLTGDRLSCLQSALSAELRDLERAVSFDNLVRRAPRLSRELRIYWKAFSEDKAQDMLDRVRALEGAVEESVQALAEQTSAVIKGLSETMLAAVAVVLGSFVASLLDKDATREVLTLGIALYVVYLLAFPLAYNMTEQWSAYQGRSRRSAARRHRLAERLDADKVREIENGEVAGSEKRFRRWFWATVSTYLIVAVLLLAFIPTFVASMPSRKKASPSVTPAPAPAAERTPSP